MQPRGYLPHYNRLPDAEVAGFVATVGTATLVTVAEDGLPDATFLPVLLRDDVLVGHLARANPHWRRIAPGLAALAVVTGPDAYVSPSWYPSKAEHGKAVPTWNYSVIQLRGRVRIVDDRDWLLDLVTELTDRHETGREHRWRVSDAPESYLRPMLRAIVGFEVQIGSVEAKAKLSQNRSAADRAGVIAGLGADHPVARAMTESR